MTDEEKNLNSTGDDAETPEGNRVKRYSYRDRKNKLKAQPLEFPPDEPAPLEAPASDETPVELPPDSDAPVTDDPPADAPSDSDTATITPRDFSVSEANDSVVKEADADGQTEIPDYVIPHGQDGMDTQPPEADTNDQELRTDIDLPLPVEEAIPAAENFITDEPAQADLDDVDYDNYAQDAFDEGDYEDEYMDDEGEFYDPPLNPPPAIPPTLKTNTGFASLPTEVKKTKKRAPIAANRAVPVKKKRNPLIYNLFTLLFLLGIVGLIAYVAILWQDPYSSLNLFPPSTPLPIYASETPTLTPTITATPSRTPTFTPTSTPITPTATDAPTETFTPVALSDLGITLGTPSPVAQNTTSDPDAPTVASTPEFAYSLQAVAGRRVVYIANPSGRGGCAWSSITGTVTDLQGAALNGYGIRIQGENLDETLASGSTPSAGRGGFEILLGIEAIAADYTVQLLDPSGEAVSPVYPVTTSADCALNIAKLQFVQIR